MKKEYKKIFDKEVYSFGIFKGMEWFHGTEDFEPYKEYKNKISQDKIIEHIKAMEPAVIMARASTDIFTNETIGTAGYYVDGEFSFPIDFPFYMQKYNIGIPYEYEEYLTNTFGL